MVTCSLLYISSVDQVISHLHSSFSKLLLSNSTINKNWIITMKSNFLRKATQPLRHKIVKTITPHIWNTFQTLGVEIFPRPMIKQLPTKDPLIGVEIGVYLGLNAESILQSSNIKTLYLIDPYSEGYMQLTHRNLDYNEAKKRVAPFSNKTKWLIQTSENAVNHIPSNLDFVYIDGNHNEQSVSKDIELYYPKIKKGGILGGHDFQGKYQGVIKAVVNFVKKENLDLNVESIDWWIIKQEKKG